MDVIRTRWEDRPENCHEGRVVVIVSLCMSAARLRIGCGAAHRGTLIELCLPPDVVQTC